MTDRWHCLNAKLDLVTQAKSLHVTLSFYNMATRLWESSVQKTLLKGPGNKTLQAWWEHFHSLPLGAINQSSHGAYSSSVWPGNRLHISSGEQWSHIGEDNADGGIVYISRVPSKPGLYVTMSLSCFIHSSSLLYFNRKETPEQISST